MKELLHQIDVCELPIFLLWGSTKNLRREQPTLCGLSGMTSERNGIRDGLQIRLLDDGVGDVSYLHGSIWVKGLGSYVLISHLMCLRLVDTRPGFRLKSGLDGPGGLKQIYKRYLHLITSNLCKS